MKRLTGYILLCCLLLAGGPGCSTKKNTWLTRGYHRMNTRYNGYFYAREAIKDGVAKIDKAYVDDYANILPLYKYAQKESLKMASGDMDKAIKKCTSAIERHMITDKKNVEIAGANSWIEDCFLAIGKARFYKQEYFAAIDAFEYVTKKYAKWPIKYDGFLWLIRTYNETSAFAKAEELLTLLENDKAFPKKKREELLGLSADYLIKRDQYENAIKDLTKAIALMKTPTGAVARYLPASRTARRERARFTYVLAQLYEKTGNYKKASDLFGQVVKLKPAYDLEFNARLNRARLYDFSGGKGAEIKQQLAKMLKDEKNTEYLDQIYFTLANIALRENQEAEGIDYLKHSVKASIKNQGQKARSYLRLADLYYDKPEYKYAQAYYDSVVPLIKKDYPNYELIVAKQKNLNELIRNLNVISLEDSLQRVAKMDTTARYALIDNLIEKAKAEEKKKAEEKLAAVQNKDSGPANNNNPNAAAGSWYFYNPSAISFGITDFKKKWGDRKLEDNWRRLNKESNGFGDVIPTTPDVQDTASKTTTVAVKETKKNTKGIRDPYLRNLPFTKEAVDRSTNRILEAYYNTGTIYKEQLENNPKAATAFEDMLARFPETKYTPTVDYFLYRLYVTMKDDKKAEYYRQQLLTKYPESEYVHLMKNPNYYKDSKANQDVVKTYYTDTYAQFLAGNYPEVEHRCATADSLYGGSKLSSRFAYLNALSIGHTGTVKEFEGALTAILVKYNKDDIRKEAQNMIDMIKRVQGGGKAAAKADSIAAAEAKIKKDKYTYREDVPHYAVIVLHGKNVNVSTFKINLSNFNAQYFSTITLTINSILMGDDAQIVSVKDFPDKKGAMIYYDFVKGDKDVFRDIPLSSVDVFVMSLENFSVFFKEKSTDEYKAFFNTNYFNKKSP